ncbi:F-box/kelch-repeat protein At3g06240-like [Cornus florida]|uniref:F-box/kelch-repeat protein At3g06240-like n=1 Tax=Cornus florida TaxID=4283 RepID=UPI002899C0B9|nr:F-box/kelch-repeat protein At3g06240-like [Cornus florida]
MADNIPNEVMMEILGRLPVKTLLRARCVCKSWCSLISSDNFVTFWFNRITHLNNINNTHLLLIKHYNKREEKEHFSLYLDDESITEYDLNLEDRPYAYIYPYLTILGSCNGLVCLIDDMLSLTDLLYLWNPTIRKFVVLPEPRITFRSHGAYDRALGFGVDSATNDYKVVRIAYVSGGPEVDIYSVQEGGWRNISVSGPIPNIKCEASNVYLNGAIHWVSGGYSRLFIVSFNLGTEVFSEMELPSSLRYIRQSRRLSVAVFHDSLCVFHTDSWEGKSSIWLMKQYGVVESWTNLFSLDFGRGGSVKVIGLKRNGEVLFTNNEEIISVDIKSPKLKYLGIHGEDVASSVNTYTESLVLIDKPMPVLDENNSSEC